jgi:hypothetical protein
MSAPNAAAGRDQSIDSPIQTTTQAPNALGTHCKIAKMNGIGLSSTESVIFPDSLGADF